MKTAKERREEETKLANIEWKKEHERLNKEINSIVTKVKSVCKLKVQSNKDYY